MIVGARRDPDWGVVLMAGLGGIWTEALDDVRILSPDMDEADMMAELRQLKGARVLAGMRGAPPLDVGAVAGTLVVLAGMMQANPDLMEIDINPLCVRPAGQGVEALDALLVFSG